MRNTLRGFVHRFALLLVLLGTAAACGATVEPLPLSITLEASRETAPVGEFVDFVVSARGGTLILIEIDYGDGQDDEVGPAGARTARFTFPHVYAAAGTYQVTATVVDANAGTRTATVEVSIQ